MDAATTFGVWLRQRRKARDLTQDQLAQQVGCSLSALRKIEADERRPSRQLSSLLAQRLELPPEDHATFVRVARGELRADRLPAVSAVQAASKSPPTSAPDQPRPRSDLPAAVTPLLGREPELAALARLIRDPACRLLTLVGPGGIGKTRLALQAAATHRSTFADGAVFVPLASINSADLILPAIAAALGYAFRSPSDPQAQLCQYLQDKALLLLLDNFEHLLPHAQRPDEQAADTASSLLTEMLEQAPGVKLLVTSRERLNLHAEWTFELQALPVPPASDTLPMPDGETAASGPEPYSAVALFVQSAQRSQAVFKLKPEERPWVARICRLVEGMPLGIELAAAWVRVLTCREIALEIERSLDFLETDMRDLPDRHRSLRAVFDHSWNLLSDKEKNALCSLSILAGEFSRDAAIAVLDEGASSASTTGRASLLTLSGLVNKSMLHRTETGRYGLHELVRQYAAAQLEAGFAGQTRLNELHLRAADWYAQAGLASDALRHAFAACDLDRVTHLLEQNADRMWMRGQVTALHHWLGMLPAEALRARPRLLLALVWTRFLLMTDHGETQLAAIEAMLPDAEESLRLAADREPRAAPGAGNAEYAELRGMLAGIQASIASHRPNSLQTITLAHQALDTLPASSLVWRIAPLLDLGLAYLDIGDLAAASQSLAAALDLSRVTGNIYTLLEVSATLARTRVVQGQLEAAAELYQQGLSLAQREAAENIPVVNVIHAGLGNVLFEWNDLESAASHLRLAYTRAVQYQKPWMLLETSLSLAFLKQAQGAAGEALDWLGKAEHLGQIAHLPHVALRLSACRARLLLAQGQTPDVSLWQPETHLNSERYHGSENEYAQLTLARLRLAQGHPAEALSLLERLAVNAEAGGRRSTLIEALMLCALARQVQGAAAQARAAIERALAIAEPEGYIRLFVDEGSPMVRLLEQLGEAHPLRGYVAKLLAACEPGG